MIAQTLLLYTLKSAEGGAPPAAEKRESSRRPQHSGLYWKSWRRFGNYGDAIIRPDYGVRPNLKRIPCTSQLPHKFVNFLFILVIVKDKLTVLWGS